MTEVRLYNHDRLRQLETAGHFWILARELMLERILRRYSLQNAKTLLDAGSGTGRWAEHLAGTYHRVFALDCSCEAAARSDRACWIGGDVTRLPFRDASLDVVTMLDVLEHLDEDLAALSEVWRVLAPGGHVLLTVPALPGLWSLRDDLAGHRRRYLHGPLMALVSNAGFQVLECRYAFFLLLPVTWLSRFSARRLGRFPAAEQALPAWLNAWLLWICRLEQGLSRWLAWPAGSSLLLLARKP